MAEAFMDTEVARARTSRIPGIDKVLMGGMRDSHDDRAWVTISSCGIDTVSIDCGVCMQPFLDEPKATVKWR
jgi:hypothetical protein